MKNYISMITSLIGMFIFSIFMGVVVIAIGLGAAFPYLNIIAKPFVCFNGKMVYEQTVSNPLPTTTYTQLSWYCVNGKSGARTELGVFPMALFSGAFYGFLLFLVIFVFWLINQIRGQNPSSGALQRQEDAEQLKQYREHVKPQQAGVYSVQKGGAAKDPEVRLKRLEELRSQNMISEAEYEQKRAEILKDL
jgi:hypothetical protein